MLSRSLEFTPMPSTESRAYFTAEVLQRTTLTSPTLIAYRPGPTYEWQDCSISTAACFNYATIWPRVGIRATHCYVAVLPSSVQPQNSERAAMRLAMFDSVPWNSTTYQQCCVHLAEAEWPTSNNMPSYQPCFTR